MLSKNIRFKNFTNKKFNTEWARLIERNAPLSERKNYLKFVKSKTGENIAQTLDQNDILVINTCLLYTS